jgi:predicted thioesterase
LKDIFSPGDKKVFHKTVLVEDTAVFEAGEVHPVYATFALARDAEWSSRLFVLEMKEAGEEGIGTFIHVDHKSPALVGEKVAFEAVFKEWNGNEFVCTFTAKAGERLIAEGSTGQKILKREKLDRVFENLSAAKGVGGA